LQFSFPEGRIGTNSLNQAVQAQARKKKLNTNYWLSKQIERGGGRNIKRDQMCCPPPPASIQWIGVEK